ncbi:MAG: MFS transporter [Chloroflexi bacterium]|nr:MFS transporter [Chloroflexota bacterium]
MNLIDRVREDLALDANIRKLYLYRFLMNFQLWWPIWVVYLLRDRGLSLTQITLLDTPFFLLIVLSEVPTGAIADRFGRRVSLMLGSGLFAVAVFVFGLADSYVVILISYTAWGLGQTFQSGADAAILYDSLKLAGREDEFQKVNSRLWALTSFAVLLAILIGAPIAAWTSLSLPILLSAGIAMMAVPVAFTLHEPKVGAGEHEDYLQMVREGVGQVWRRPVLRYIVVYSGVLMASTFTPLIFMQPYLQHHGVGTGALGLWQAPVRAVGIVSALAAYQFVSRAGQRQAFFALPVTLGVSAVLLAGVDRMFMYPAFLGIGFVAGIQNPVLATYINHRIPSERRATILSVQSVIGNFIFAGSQPFGGFIADEWGLRTLFLVFGVITIVVGTGVLILWSRAEADETAGSGGDVRADALPEPLREPVAASS